MQQTIKESHQNCPICLSKVRNPAKPDQCSHLHCQNCLRQWTKIQNTCPVCKQRFRKIVQTVSPKDSRRGQKEKGKYMGSKTKEENIADRSQRQKEGEEEERMFAVLLGRQTRRNELEFINLMFMLESIVEE